MNCEVSISPYEGNEDDEFVEPPRVRISSEPPEGTNHDEHPAFDREIEQDVRQAFDEAVPTDEQLRFLNQYDYPFQYPVVATVEWYPNKSVSDLAEEMDFSEKFL